MKYLVTDPCYIMSDKQWVEIGDKHGWDTDDWPVPIEIDGGKITAISTTKNGDGSMSINGSMIGVDSGTVCLAEVSDDFDNSNKYHGSLGVFADSLSEAASYFARAKTI